ncbi:hypothetical protein ACJX0J_010328, partial [Zea mays]
MAFVDDEQETGEEMRESTVERITGGFKDDTQYGPWLKKRFWNYESTDYVAEIDSQIKPYDKLYGKALESTTLGEIDKILILSKWHGLARRSIMHFDDKTISYLETETGAFTLELITLILRLVHMFAYVQAYKYTDLLA